MPRPGVIGRKRARPAITEISARPGTGLGRALQLGISRNPLRPVHTGEEILSGKTGAGPVFLSQTFRGQTEMKVSGFGPETVDEIEP